MSDVYLDDTKAQELIERIAKMVDAEELLRLLELAGRRVGAKGEELAGAYPDAPDGRPLRQIYMLNGKPSAFKSIKQQRKVFALIHEGKIPYRRSGKLGASMTSHVEVDAHAVTVAVGTNVPYAPYVIGGPGQQSGYHAETGWQSLPVALKQHAEDLLEPFDKTLKDYVDNLGAYHA